MDLDVQVRERQEVVTTRSKRKGTTVRATAGFPAVPIPIRLGP
jgi:hypothetical protein